MANLDPAAAASARHVKTRISSDDDEANEDGDAEYIQDSTRRIQQQRLNLFNKYVLTRPILSKFGLMAMSYFRLPPRPTFLLGSLDKELVVTQKRARQRRVQNDHAEAKRTKIKELESDDESNNSTVIEIERIFKVLKRIYKKLQGMLKSLKCSISTKINRQFQQFFNLNCLAFKKQLGQSSIKARNLLNALF